MIRIGSRAAIRLALALIGFMLVSSCAPDGILGVSEDATFEAGTGLHSIEVGSLSRDYILHVPAHRPTSTSGTLMAYPLIIVLHGSSGNAQDIRETTQMDSLGEVNHSIVAYPNGVSGAGGLFPTDWNAGTCCGAANREDIDDVAFIAAVIAEISNKLTVDKTRIYVAGFSDGGRLAHHLACVLSPQIAAIGVVSGSMKDDHCVPSKVVSVLAIHGTDDDVVPYDEPSDTPPPGNVIDGADDLPPAVQFWVAENACTVATPTSVAAHVTRTAFTKCNGADVAFYSIDGGTHTWPISVSGSDDPDSQLAASVVIAQFFARHTRR